MKKIKDERLILQNLKNIRIAFLVQSAGIVAILLYETISKGFSEVSDNPLWFVFILTGVILSWLNLRISVDMDDKSGKKAPGPYYPKVVIAAVVGMVSALLVKFGPDGGSTRNAIIIGIVLFVCFLASYSFVHYLRKKRSDHDG
ncbi:hypothetical protein SAMN05421676_107145 [Salinibacillus kushneri]|uniref:Branched-chain amino acid ABC transporter substrate-binding protein n=1 Tax=Salinibacillus kushneri TaxID=237682 RepID=A0A1I0GUW2_9BACI|nr:hypothetical protein [Salinibacillus kushneri]SET74071.1 hypothetical protein SAMN05421676_107145 [Salinibacillus kushneri]